MRNLRDYEDRYMETGFEDIQVYYRRKKILETVEKYRPECILEIGCGMDPLFQYVDFSRYLFFEPADAFFENATKLAGDDARISGYMEPFQYKAEAAEEKPSLILCTSLLHELENPQAMLEDIHKTCSEDTVVHINVPNALSFHRTLGTVMGLLGDEKDFSKRNIDFQQHHVFDLSELCSLVESCGFRILEKGSFFVKPFSHKQMFELVRQNIIDRTVLDGLFHLTDRYPDIGAEIYVNCVKENSHE